MTVRTCYHLSMLSRIIGRRQIRVTKKRAPSSKRLKNKSSFTTQQHASTGMELSHESSGGWWGLNDKLVRAPVYA